MNINSTQKTDSKTRTILRQNQEIKKLINKISELEIKTNQKDELSQSINIIYSDLIELISELEEKCKEYDLLICDLIKMKNIMKEANIKIPWYKKFENKIKKINIRGDFGGIT